VTIIGAGPIGLLHLLVAKKVGVETVIMTDLVEERLQFAAKLGADETINAKAVDVLDAVKKLTDGQGADVVIEAIGTPATWEQALKLTCKGGTVLEFGGCPPGSEIRLDTELLHYGEVTVRGAFHATPTHFKKALNLIASGALDVKPLVTRRMPLDEIREAFEILSSSKTEIKISIQP
jgi:L-iditol 2-dehydrogenase